MMKDWIFIIAINCIGSIAIAQDWNGIPVPADAGLGNSWVLQQDVSDDFNYTSAPTTAVNTINGKWINWYHNAWSGPLPTVWKRDHVKVENGNFQIMTSRTPGDSTVVNGTKLATINLGCATSTTRVQYPVYIEANVKIMKSVLASNVWLLSPDDTQEIDICEAYGSSRWTNAWFSDERLHLSHHVFIRQPFTDWQPNDGGSFYTDGSTVWSDGYHRIGVYWKSPWHLEYYVDGVLVRTRSGKNQIDPVYHTNSVNPGDASNDTRTGLSKPMDIIINTEDQTWRSLQGLTPTAAELTNAANNTFGVDWIRVYKLSYPTATNSITKATKTLKAFPNPTDNYLKIEDENLKGDYSMQIISVTGQVMRTEIVNGNNGIIELQVENLPQGFYSVRLVADEVYVVPFVKQ